MLSFVATLDGITVLPVSSPLQKGQKVWVWVRGFERRLSGGALNPEGIRLDDVQAICQRTISTHSRLEVLQRQQHYLADDQLASSLGRIAGACDNVRLVDPVLMMKCVQDEDPDPLRPLGAAFTRQTVVITAVPVAGHWVTFAWRLHNLKFRAWDSCPVGQLDVAVSSVHRIWGKVLGFRSSSFSFSQALARPLAPGLCGHFALAADLWCHSWNHPSLP